MAEDIFHISGIEIHIDYCRNCIDTLKVNVAASVQNNDAAN